MKIKVTKPERILFEIGGSIGITIPAIYEKIGYRKGDTAIIRKATDKGFCVELIKGDGKDGKE